MVVVMRVAGVEVVMSRCHHQPLCTKISPLIFNLPFLGSTLEGGSGAGRKAAHLSGKAKATEDAHYLSLS